MRTLAPPRGLTALIALCTAVFAVAFAVLPVNTAAANAANAAGPAPAFVAVPHGAPARPAAPAAPHPSLQAHPLASAPGPLDNPLKGFATFYSPGGDENAGYPRSLQWSYFGLSEVMTDPNNCGSFDWSIVDNALNEIASYGNQAAIRFYMEYPGGTGSHPADAVPHCFDGKVAYRTNTYWGTTSPDYDSPYLLNALGAFIAAYGARYDGDPRIGFINLGLVGLWGEWHTWPYDTDTTGDSYPNFMPTDAHAAQIIQDYDNAFSRTKLEVRYPTSGGGAANNLDIGYHDDSFCYREGSPLAGVTLPQSLGGADYAQLQLELNEGTENKWITDSMGGEVRPEIQSSVFSSWPGGSGQADNIKACIELEHTTWKIDETSQSYSPTDPNVGAAVRLMGYDLGVTDAYFKNSASGTATVGVRMTNDGVAPFYYPWTVTLGLKDGAGHVVKTWDTPWDLRTVMPGKIRAFPDWGLGPDPTYLDYGYPQYFQTAVDLSSVATGDYQLVLRVKNPLEAVSANAKKLRFANATQNADGWLGLGTMGVGGSGGDTGGDTGGTGGGSGGSYEAEAPGNTLTGTAAVAACAVCSGGAKVGYLGNGGALTFTGVDGGSGGTKTVTVHYATAETRTATISVNGGAATTVTFPSTGDWNTLGTASVTLTLAAGAGNTIRIANPSGWAPDIDRIVVGGTTAPPAPGSYEAEAPANTLTGGAVVASCSGCSGGAKVGYVGKGAKLTLTGVDGGSGGTKTLTVYYVSSVSRSATVQIDSAPAVTVNFPATADWNTVGSVPVTVTLPAGTANTVTLANASDWAPDIDRITVS
ncbi:MULTISPECIES: carbohydrate-binding protein [unclassified Streptomyces]|uniref:carbohydrate-binding protein n=1 Tax=unclassified Streptomyces TaxID=2593676 RepID=UPI002E29CFA2|nr:carbohydrate-binding protein [Streptomyces sp. NBC_00223]